MIRSFKSKTLRSFAETGNASKLSVQNSARVTRILNLLDRATKPEDMNAPGYFFHTLRGHKPARYTVRVTGNYRIPFAFDGEDAIDVDLEDYHGK